MWRVMGVQYSQSRLHTMEAQTRRPGQELRPGRSPFPSLQVMSLG